MAPINVMMNGIPGNAAVTIAKHLAADERFRLIPYAFTGPEIAEKEFDVDGYRIRLIQPDQRTQALNEIKEKGNVFISVDYTHPSAVNDNADFYCNHHLPFVMGTTGGDRERLGNTVLESDISAVIAPNMAKQIVGFQAIMEYAAKTFPDLFKGYTLELKESHQSGKADTSGTAKAMVGYFNAMGIPFGPEDIQKERDPEVQQHQWGIPEAYLSGHAWHTYTLVSEDKTARFEFTHNINGRDIYAHGTIDAICYLQEKVDAGEKGKVFTMIDVLKGI